MSSKKFHNVFAWGQAEQQLADIQKKFLGYLPAKGKILDLGCGRGVFLDLLSQDGFSPVGVDMDKTMAEECKKKGHKVIIDNAISFLEKTKDKYDGILASHIIEHMSVEDQKKLIKLMKERLNPNGVAIVVTPRPGSLWATEAFWLDTTHVRPIAYGLMEALFQPFDILAGGIEPDSDPTLGLGRKHKLILSVRKRILGRELYDFVYGGGVSYIIAKNS